MTYEDIKDMIEDTTLPFTYDSFPNNIAPQPPYIVFNFPYRNDFGADNINYAKIDTINIELYTSSKDFELESQIEDHLTSYGLYYTKSETYIRSENLYQITYVAQEVITNTEE